MELSDDPFRIEERPHSPSSSSSHTESLLASSSPPQGDPVPLPQHRRTVSYRDDTDAEATELELEMENLSSPRRGRPIGQSKVVIPTPEQVDLWSNNKRPRERHPKMILAGLAALLAGAIAISQLLAIGTRFGHSGVKINVILMVSDGMGPASETLARTYLSHLANNDLLNISVWASLAPYFPTSSPPNFHLTPLDSLLVGTSRTRSSSSLITDSAAGATAFASGIHTYNGAIGIEPVGKTPVGTVLEAAKRQGFGTGLVSTSRVTHATPAAFYSHVVDRDLESEIAPFILGLGPQKHIVDIALGGGACFFAPNTVPTSCRTDSRDILAEAEAAGRKVTVLRGLQALNEWHDEGGHEKMGEEQEMVLGLFHESHMDFEVDRRVIESAKNQQPTLRQMAMHALGHLDGKYDKGFFLMIEGSRIDMAAHNNDPIGHISDMLAYLTTVDYVRQWVDDKNAMGERTMLISVSDHETGGLALGRQIGEEYPDYLWYPEVLLNATHSTEYLGDLIAAQDPTTVNPAYLTLTIYGDGLGIVDASTEEVSYLLEHKSDAYRLNLALAQSISRRAQLGWSTVGHSAVDVNLYAAGYNVTGLTGNRENTEIGEHIAHAMGLQLEAVTLELNKDLSWFLPETGKQMEESRRTSLAHYHGDF